MARINESANRELNEYLDLYASLEDMHRKFLERKQILRLLLEETIALKKEALLVLAKANRLTKHLTGRQRQAAGFTYHLNDIHARIRQAHTNSLALSRDVSGEAATLPALGKDCRNRSELRQKGLLILRMIDQVKKKLLELELIELRCRELILSINKALEAFRHEYRIIRRRIYPLGILSLIHRSMRFLWGGVYFSPGDLEEVGALGKITGLVLEIADSELA